MKKKVVFTIFVTALILFIGQVGFAQELGKKFGIGARVSYYHIADDTTPLGDTESDGTIFGEANITYFFNNWFSLELSSGYAKSDLDFEQSGAEFGEIEQIPVLLTGRFHWWNEIPLVGFYVGGGVGYFFNDFDVSAAFRSANPGIAVDMDDSFGFHIAGGLEYFVTESLALNVDLKYILNEADFVTTQPDLTFDLDLDAFVGGVGIKYYF